MCPWRQEKNKISKNAFSIRWLPETIVSQTQLYFLKVKLYKTDILSQFSIQHFLASISKPTCPWNIRHLNSSRGKLHISTRLSSIIPSSTFIRCTENISVAYSWKITVKRQHISNRDLPVGKVQVTSTYF